MYQIKIHHSVYNMPDSDDLTFDQFISLIKATDDMQRLEAVLGKQIGELPSSEKVSRQMQNVLKLLDKLQQDNGKFLNGLTDPPEFIECKILATPIKLNKDLGKQPYWAMNKVKDIVQSMGDNPYDKFEQYKYLVGHFTYCLVKKEKYNEYLAETYCEEVIGNLPFKEVIRMGDFFLYMQHRYWMKKINYLKLNLRVMTGRIARYFSRSTAS